MRPLSERSVVLLLLFALTIFRLIYAAQLGMTYDECYYWQWSRHLDVGYYDQGPGIAYCIRLGTLLLGDTPLGVRLVNILLAAGSAWCVYLTATRWFDKKIAVWSVVLMAVAPLYGMGSMLATYDGPQVFCWALGMYWVTRTLQEDNARLWYVVGLCVGLGLLCKLTMVVFAPSVLLLLVLAPDYRKHLSTLHPYLAFVLALLCASPLVYWNLTHGNVNFQHALALSSRSRGASFGRWLGDFLGGQLLVVGPWLFIAELVALYQMTRQMTHKPDNPRRFLLAFTLPMLALCFWTALRSKMEANWAAPLHLAGMIAIAVGFAGAWQQKKRVGVLFCGFLCLLIQIIVLFPEWLGKIKPLDGKTVGIKLCEPYDWSPMVAVTQEARERLASEGKPVMVVGMNYRVNSVMSFYLKDRPIPQALYLGSRLDQYYFWTDAMAMRGKNAVLCFDQEVDRPDNKDNPLPEIRKYFASVDFYAKRETYRPGFAGPVKVWVVYLCRDFKGYNPQEHFTGY
jgi:4-amino-4-deoxy-L-arabinose transferase-like glycosyltransferase